MKEIEFTWDATKALANENKHGISFEEGTTVFSDENILIMHDEDHSDDEDRYLILGMSENLRILVVVHCYRKNDTEIRIISARKATRFEIFTYEENR